MTYHQLKIVSGLLPLVALAACPALAADQRKIVIPFDFLSKFDDGRYGQQLGEMVWTKIQREGRFLVPETHGDTRDFCKSHAIVVTPDTPLEKMKKIVREDFEAQIGVWGSVERVPGHDTDVYDLVIKCVDFSTPAGPKVIYECSVRTKTVSEIPHLYVKQMLDALYGRKPAAPAPVDAVAEENWKKGPNLVVGGDFQQGSRGVPKGWEPVGGHDRQPLGRLVQWVPEAGNPGNKVLRFQFDHDVGDTTGVLYYSEPFPIQQGATYRFQCRWRSNGPDAKVFIKCYAAVGQTREVYRSQQNLRGPQGVWNVQTQDFTPRHAKFEPRTGRIMLLAIGAGTVDFDDVVVKLIAPTARNQPTPAE